ncbi:MAG: 2-C-methyl-D-erythritol 4-phosphate cytidylyltransferase [Lachnospiraceae bacterium]|nr:2-C-methyl-D-erythritol 4-phosphate cytidylyltransferase [Lachnospiraceae bacterium]
MNIALILSGGVGTRLEADIPKQYIEVNGKRVIDYCLEIFEECDCIDAIQIVAAEEWRTVISENSYSKLKGFSQPGENRQLSILNGLEDIRGYAEDEDVVVIHDAARPLVSQGLIESLVKASEAHDGALPVLPMKDTVYFSENGQQISSLLDRSCIYAGQAPESFVFGKYYQANKRLEWAEILKINGSTEPAILAGMDVAMIPGDERNFKITTKEDLKRFSEIIASNE